MKPTWMNKFSRNTCTSSSTCRHRGPACLTKRMTALPEGNIKEGKIRRCSSMKTREVGRGESSGEKRMSSRTGVGRTRMLLNSLTCTSSCAVNYIASRICVHLLFFVMINTGTSAVLALNFQEEGSFIVDGGSGGGIASAEYERRAAGQTPMLAGATADDPQRFSESAVENVGTTTLRSTTSSSSGSRGSHSSNDASGSENEEDLDKVLMQKIARLQEARLDFIEKEKEKDEQLREGGRTQDVVVRGDGLREVAELAPVVKVESSSSSSSSSSSPSQAPAVFLDQEAASADNILRTTAEVASTRHQQPTLPLSTSKTRRIEVESSTPPSDSLSTSRTAVSWSSSSSSSSKKGNHIEDHDDKDSPSSFRGAKNHGDPHVVALAETASRTEPRLRSGHLSLVEDKTTSSSSEVPKQKGTASTIPASTVEKSAVVEDAFIPAPPLLSSDSAHEMQDQHLRIDELGVGGTTSDRRNSMLPSSATGPDLAGGYVILARDRDAGKGELQGRVQHQTEEVALTRVVHHRKLAGHRREEDRHETVEHVLVPRHPVGFGAPSATSTDSSSASATASSKSKILVQTGATLDKRDQAIQDQEESKIIGFTSSDHASDYELHQDAMKEKLEKVPRRLISEKDGVPQYHERNMTTRIVQVNGKEETYDLLTNVKRISHERIWYHNGADGASEVNSTSPTAIKPAPADLAEARAADKPPDMIVDESRNFEPNTVINNLYFDANVGLDDSIVKGSIDGVGELSLHQSRVEGGIYSHGGVIHMSKGSSVHGHVTTSDNVYCQYSEVRGGMLIQSAYLYLDHCIVGGVIECAGITSAIVVSGKGSVFTAHRDCRIYRDATDLTTLGMIAKYRVWLLMLISSVLLYVCIVLTANKAILHEEKEKAEGIYSSSIVS
ncbi:unnamed protein product [Amoebophrya sp. A25]|nr:unnamed protein product [Amoebophrya sp. A25]|eukprot:GSA25T00006916001.1